MSPERAPRRPARLRVGHCLDALRRAEECYALASLTSRLASLTDADHITTALVRGLHREFGYRRLGYFHFDRAALALEGRESAGVRAAAFRDLRLSLSGPVDAVARAALFGGQPRVVETGEAVAAPPALYGALGRPPAAHALFPVAGSSRSCWKEMRCGNRLCPFYRRNGGTALEEAERRRGLEAVRPRIEAFLRCERFPVQGVLWIETERGKHGPGDLRLLGSLAGTAGAVLENSFLYRRLEWLSTTDPLTGVNNRRSFLQTLEAEIARSTRTGGGFAVLMLDLDDFKAFNDAHGHLAGDRAMRGVGEVFRTTLRRSDHAARYGGEEFAVVLPDTSLAAATAVADRLRERVAALDEERPGVPGKVTASVGVAAFPESGVSRDEVLASADRALYSAKGRGKNRVMVIGPEGEVREDAPSEVARD